MINNIEFYGTLASNIWNIRLPRFFTRLFSWKKFFVSFSISFFILSCSALYLSNLETDVLGKSEAAMLVQKLIVKIVLLTIGVEDIGGLNISES